MKRLAATSVLVLSMAVLLFKPADAGSTTLEYKTVMKALGTSITIPTDWDGIWATEDSIFDCTAGFSNTATDKDTICGGQIYTQTVPTNPVTLTCDGTADATTIHATCTGSYEIITDCQAVFNVQVDNVRSGSTYRSVTTVDVTYQGAGEGCGFLPTHCLRVVRHATRTGPAPPAKCLTSVKPTSWGRLKMLYR